MAGIYMITFCLIVAVVIYYSLFVAKKSEGADSLEF